MHTVPAHLIDAARKADLYDIASKHITEVVAEVCATVAIGGDMTLQPAVYAAAAAEVRAIAPDEDDDDSGYNAALLAIAHAFDRAAAGEVACTDTTPAIRFV